MSEFLSLVNREDLLQILYNNRTTHETEFNAALKTWKKKCLKRLRKEVRRIEESGHVELYPLNDLPKPKSYLKAYDSAIRRLEMDIRENVELTGTEFSAWVEDEWEWRGMFQANTSLYNG